MRPISKDGWILLGLGAAYFGMLWYIKQPEPKDRYQMFVESPAVVFRLDKSSGRLERYVIRLPEDVEITDVTSHIHSAVYKEMMRDGPK